MSKEDYMPLWRAKAGAKALFGDLAKIWEDGGRCYVGCVERVAMSMRAGHPAIGKGVRIYGVGTHWKEALEHAAKTLEARRQTQPKEQITDAQ